MGFKLLQSQISLLDNLQMDLDHAMSNNCSTVILGNFVYLKPLACALYDKFYDIFIDLYIYVDGSEFWCAHC